MSSDVVLRVQNLSKCFEIYDKPVHRLYQTLCFGWKKFYKEFWALDNINFEVRKGECVGIIGRNGAGKSTLLQIITGTLQPTNGIVETHGRIAALLELGSGFNPEFTGRENVYMNAAILGLSNAEIDAKYQEIIDFADIGDFIDQPVKTYSSGMLVRLAFSVQTMIDPDILIVDEALAVGDVLFQKKCFARINELVRKGVTFLFVTHDLETMRSMTQKALLLRKGCQDAFDKSADVLLRYRDQLHQDEEKYMEDILQRLQQSSALHENSSNDAPPENDKMEIAANAEEEKGTAESAEESTGETVAESGESSAAAPAKKLDMSKDPLNSAFGNKEVEIVSVKSFDENGKSALNFYTGEKIRIRVECLSHIDIDHLNVAIRIRNKQGVKIYSWGTLNQDKTRSVRDGATDLFWNRNFKAGETFAVNFECNCDLGADLYEVQASVSYEGDLDYMSQRMLHWRDNALYLRVAMNLKEYWFGGCTDLRMKAVEEK